MTRIFSDDYCTIVKQVIVVDADVDIYNPNDVEWAITTRVQAVRDVLLLPDMRGVGPDSSQVPSRRYRSDKMGIDATIPSYVAYRSRAGWI